MTDVVTGPKAQATTSYPSSPTTPTGPSPTSLHAMSTRSSNALARRQSTQHQQAQALHSRPPSATESQAGTHGLPSSVEGRLTRKRARSINVEEANHSREERLTLQSPALAGTPPSSASTVSNSDLICICPAPPKVPRPRNAFILYRQHNQAAVVNKHPGLANPDISKIIGEQWRKESDENKNYWKRLAEEEKARHQRQYPQYKYQPRRGGKNGPAARAAAAAGAGEDQGRCPNCGGRHNSTPRTPSTPFGGIPGPEYGFGPISASAMQPFIKNDPRVIEPMQKQPHHRLVNDSQYGSMGDSRRQQHSYYPLPPEPLRPIEEDYETGIPPGMSRRRGPEQNDYDMLTLPDLKRRRFDVYPERGSPMSAVSQHRGQQQQQQQQYPIGGQAPYPQYPVQYSVARRSSSVSAGGSVYSNQPSSAGGGNYPTAPLPHPCPPPGESQPQQAPQKHQQQQHEQSQQQSQQQQGRVIGMAPPPRPSRLSTASSVPPPPPGLPTPYGTTRDPGYELGLALPPLKIPSSPTHYSVMGDSARSLSGSGPSGLGMESQPHQMLAQHGDSQARGIEAMIMSIPFTNKLDVLRKISPALCPPGAGSPGVATRGPVIAIEGSHVALMRAVRPVIERALRASGECDLKMWTDSSVDRASPLSVVVAAGEAYAVQKKKKPVTRQGGSEDFEMTDIRDKLSVASGSRHGSLSSASKDGSKTPTPRQPGVGGASATGTSTLDYLQTILEWHNKSTEIVKHVTTTSQQPSSNSSVAASDAATAVTTTTPVAFIPGGFSLTLSDRFACTVAITDPYSPVDHWQWMATLWRGIVGPDLVVYVVRQTEEGAAAARNSGTVEYGPPGVMVVRVAGDKVDEKTERRLAFEVMEWVRAGSFREGYSFGGGGGGDGN